MQNCKLWDTTSWKTLLSCIRLFQPPCVCMYGEFSGRFSVKICYVFNSEALPFHSEWHASRKYIFTCMGYTKQLKLGTLKSATYVFIVLINFCCNSSEPKMKWNGLYVYIYTAILASNSVRSQRSKERIRIHWGECLQSKGSVDLVILIIHPLFCLSTLPLTNYLSFAYTL